MKKNAQTIIEYGLVLAFVALIAIALLGKFTSSINKVDKNLEKSVSLEEQVAVRKYCKSVHKIYNENSGKCEEVVK